MTNEEMLRRIREIRSDYDDDIKKYGMLKGYLDDAEALDKAISIIEEFLSAEPKRKMGRWIPVSERFPEEGEEVLVYLFDGESPYLAWIQDGLWRTEDFVVDADYEPVAWMPLPEPYQAERQEE